MTDRTIEIIISKENAGERLDASLSALLGISRSLAAAYAESGAITVNGRAAKKNRILKENDRVIFEEPEPVPCKAEPEDIEIEIVYEDEHLAVVNKPKGMVVHPAPGNYTGTLVSALLYKMKGRLSSINGVERPGIVHRIDKDTSGLLIIAKTDAAHLALSEQISSHSFSRKYRGIAVGNVKEEAGTVEKTVARSPKDRKKMAAGIPGGREAKTDYRVIERFPGFTYLEFTLHTGRTHQIRVHMASLHRPLMGDTVYGAGTTPFEKRYADILAGQCLHAYHIGFTHPVTGEYMEFESPLPDYFTFVLEKLKNQTNF